MPGPDTPAVIIIALALFCIPPAMEFVRWCASDPGPVRVVFLGW
jgi:hypothetical protein